jgi:hypothetical protein
VSPEVTTADPALLTVKFTQEESHDAFDSWGFNCGPAAIASRGMAALPREEVFGKGPGACEGEGVRNPKGAVGEF